MKGKRCTKEELTKDYLNVKEKIGHHPSKNEYKQHGKFSEKAFTNHFVSWGNFTLQMGGEIQKGGGKRRLEPLTKNIKKYNKHFKIYGEGILILNDLHIPYHSTKIINEALDIAERLKLYKLILAGDTFDFKGLFRKKPQDTAMDWIDEVTIGTDIMRVLVELFDSIDMIGGNHDQERLEQELKSPGRAEKLIQLIFHHPKVRYSRYQHCTVNDTWKVMHEGNSKVLLSKLEKIANVQMMSCVAAHSHRFGNGIAANGVYALCEGLHATNPDLHEYANVKVGDHSKWIEGWWMIIENKIYHHVFHPRIGNLTDLLKTAEYVKHKNL